MRTLTFESDYDLRFNADERGENEWVMKDMETSAWYLNDIMLGKHFEDNFKYEDYE